MSRGSFWGRDRPADPEALEPPGPVEPARRPPARGPLDVAPEVRGLRRLLAYALIHARAHHAQNLRALSVLADDPTIGPDHPAYVAIARTHPTNWNLRPFLVEAALGRPFADGETIDDAMRTLARVMTEGGRS